MKRKQKPRGLLKGEYVLINAQCTICKESWDASGTPPDSMRQVRLVRQQAKYHASYHDHHVEIITTKVGSYVRPLDY